MYRSLIKGKILSKNKGFTLIELMIVVAIIAILAALAIPNFLSFVVKTRRTEVKTNLEGIYKAETSYFGEKDLYSNSFVEIRWVPVGAAYYTYTLGNENFGKDVAVNPPPASVVPVATDNEFKAFGWGNIDTDSQIDVWHIDQGRVLVNDDDDLST
jgi:prepilin-type N-terminal cleavage/methylation domain-containing protein